MNERLNVEVHVNGELRAVTIRPSDTLLTLLRDQLGLTGAKPGCENGDCGACTVMVDGWPMKTCMMLGVEAAGKEIKTIEGLRDTELQRAFEEHWAFQCGYCTPGFIMNCTALIERHPDASESVIENWLQSNICRCTSYQEIKQAIQAVLTDKAVP